MNLEQRISIAMSSVNPNFQHPADERSARLFALAEIEVEAAKAKGITMNIVQAANLLYQRGELDEGSSSDAFDSGLQTGMATAGRRNASGRG